MGGAQEQVVNFFHFFWGTRLLLVHKQVLDASQGHFKSVLARVQVLLGDSDTRNNFPPLFHNCKARTKAGGGDVFAGPRPPFGGILARPFIKLWQRAVEGVPEGGKSLVM